MAKDVKNGLSGRYPSDLKQVFLDDHGAPPELSAAGLDETVRPRFRSGSFPDPSRRVGGCALVALSEFDPLLRRLAGDEAPFKIAEQIMEVAQFAT